MAVKSDEPITQQGMEAVDKAGPPDGSAGSSPDPIMLEPTQAELDDWADRERKRRKAWLDGPDRRGTRRLGAPRADAAPLPAERRRPRGGDRGVDPPDGAIPARDAARRRGHVQPVLPWSRRQMGEFVQAGSRLGGPVSHGPADAVVSGSTTTRTDPGRRDVRRRREGAPPAPSAGLAADRRRRPVLPRAQRPLRARQGPARTGPHAARARGARRRLGQARPDAGDALRPAAGRVLQRAVQAAQPGSTVSRTSRSGRSCAQELGGWPEEVFDSFEREFVRRRVDRPGPPGRPGRRARPSRSRSSAPGSASSSRSDIDLMYAVTGILDWTHAFGTTQSRQVIDEFARWTADEVDYLVEARQAVVLDDNTSGDRLERIARSTASTRRRGSSRRSSSAASRSSRSCRRCARAIEGYLEALAERGLRPQPDRPPSRLEHAQPGLRVRVLPRRPPPRERLRPAGQRHRLRRLRDRRPAARPGPALADLLHVAAVQGRHRRGGPRAHALDGADERDRRGRRPPRPRSGPRRVPVRHGGRAGRGAPGPARRGRRQPVLEAGGRHAADHPGPRARSSRRACSPI